MGDRRKSILSIAQAVEFAESTSVRSVTKIELFDVLVRFLQHRDYRAFFKAAGRVILLPSSISEKPDELDLEVYERNLLGTAKFNSDSPRMKWMTCMTYNDHDYGTITLYKVDMTKRDEGGWWPERISPVAAMTAVPKKLLTITAKSVPQSKKTILQVKTKEKDPRKWHSYPKIPEPNLAASASVQQSKLSEGMQKALAIENHELKFKREKESFTVNTVTATIPQMIAWLHVEASYLKHVRVEGTDFQRKDTKKVEYTRIVSWKNGPPRVGHEGKNPCIVILHPDKGDWVTTSVYWN